MIFEKKYCIVDRTYVPKHETGLMALIIVFGPDSISYHNPVSG
jgi:hypothetical protein